MIFHNNIEGEYFLWLLEKQLNMNKQEKKMFIELSECLFDIPFCYVIQKDKQRAGDGIYLRTRFQQETGLKVMDQEDCTVLEMLIALAVRMDGEYIGDPSDPGPLSLFIEFLNNLNLRHFVDINLSGEMKKHIHELVENWMNRRYDYNGVGGIFPLCNPREDQRDLPIWSQMQAYITENF